MRDVLFFTLFVVGWSAGVFALIKAVASTLSALGYLGRAARYSADRMNDLRLAARAGLHALLAIVVAYAVAITTVLGMRLLFTDAECRSNPGGGWICEPHSSPGN